MNEYVNHMRKNNYTDAQIATFRNIVTCIEDEMSRLKHSRRFSTPASGSGSATDFRIDWTGEEVRKWKLSVLLGEHNGGSANIYIASVYARSGLEYPDKNEGPSLFCSINSNLAKDLSALSRQIKRFKVCIETGKSMEIRNSGLL